MRVVVGSRDSELAMRQTRHVVELLQAVHPDVEFVISSSSSLGDRDLSKPLAQLAAANAGLFTKELEVRPRHVALPPPLAYSSLRVLLSRARLACSRAPLTLPCTR
jgi:hypothetical protein